MNGILGKKIGMTSIYDDAGRNIAVTVVEVVPNVVTQVKSGETDGYEALQLAAGEAKVKNTSKPMKGHFNYANTSPKRKVVEFRDFEIDKALGDEIRIEDLFEEGDNVHAVGTSKGKGFQGVVKRHGFGGVGQATHGQHNRLRAPGSIGAASYPARVFKGIKMAGQMGNERVTVQNLRVLKVVPEKNLLVVKGCVPGHKNAYITIEK